jgi:tetratricopeptide (TPR) repeat protein
VDWLLSSLSDIEKALKLDPVDAPEKDYIPNAFKQKCLALSFFELGLAELQDGDITAALDFYRRCLSPETNTVDTVVKLALTTAARDDIPEAARWFNEAVRRVSNDTDQYSSRFMASREHLEALWAIKGVTGEALLMEMEAQLPDQLETHPELQGDGYYWRYRAWLKYYFGLSAFHLGAEADAEALLQSGQADAKVPPICRATILKCIHT